MKKLILTAALLVSIFTAMDLAPTQAEAGRCKHAHCGD